MPQTPYADAEALFDQQVARFVQRMEAEGTPVTVISRKRTAREQEKLFNKTRKKGALVTNADGTIRLSNHQLGIAADMMFSHWSDRAEANLRGENWEKLGRVAKQEGLYWGGDWTNPYDPPHVEGAPPWTPEVIRPVITRKDEQGKPETFRAPRKPVGLPPRELRPTRAGALPGQAPPSAPTATVTPPPRVLPEELPPMASHGPGMVEPRMARSSPYPDEPPPLTDESAVLPEAAPIEEFDQPRRPGGLAPAPLPTVPGPRAQVSAETDVEREAAFQQWYGQRAAPLGLDPDPDAPAHQYDYRAAFRAGDEPDASGHWPSRWKRPGHPNLIVGGVNTQTGQPVPQGLPPVQPEMASLPQRGSTVTGGRPTPSAPPGAPRVPAVVPKSIYQAESEQQALEGTLPTTYAYTELAKATREEYPGQFERYSDEELVHAVHGAYPGQFKEYDDPGAGLELLPSGPAGGRDIDLSEWQDVAQPVGPRGPRQVQRGTGGHVQVTAPGETPPGTPQVPPPPTFLGTPGYEPSGEALAPLARAAAQGMPGTPYGAGLTATAAGLEAGGQALGRPITVSDPFQTAMAPLRGLYGYTKGRVEGLNFPAAVYQGVEEAQRGTRTWGSETREAIEPGMQEAARTLHDIGVPATVTIPLWFAGQGAEAAIDSVTDPLNVAWEPVKAGFAFPKYLAGFVNGRNAAAKIAREAAEVADVTARLASVLPPPNASRWSVYGAATRSQAPLFNLKPTPVTVAPPPDVLGPERLLTDRRILGHPPGATDPLLGTPGGDQLVGRPNPLAEPIGTPYTAELPTAPDEALDRFEQGLAEHLEGQVPGQGRLYGTPGIRLRPPPQVAAPATEAAGPRQLRLSRKRPGPPPDALAAGEPLRSPLEAPLVSPPGQEVLPGIREAGGEGGLFGDEAALRARAQAPEPPPPTPEGQAVPRAEYGDARDFYELYDDATAQGYTGTADEFYEIYLDRRKEAITTGRKLLADPEIVGEGAGKYAQAVEFLKAIARYGGIGPDADTGAIERLWQASEGGIWYPRRRKTGVVGKGRRRRASGIGGVKGVLRNKRQEPVKFTTQGGEVVEAPLMGRTLDEMAEMLWSTTGAHGQRLLDVPADMAAGTGSGRPGPVELMNYLDDVILPAIANGPPAVKDAEQFGRGFMGMRPGSGIPWWESALPDNRLGGMGQTVPFDIPEGALSAEDAARAAAEGVGQEGPRIPLKRYGQAPLEPGPTHSPRYNWQAARESFFSDPSGEVKLPDINAEDWERFGHAALAKARQVKALIDESAALFQSQHLYDDAGRYLKHVRLTDEQEAQAAQLGARISEQAQDLRDEILQGGLSAEPARRVQQLELLSTDEAMGLRFDASEQSHWGQPDQESSTICTNCAERVLSFLPERKGSLIAGWEDGTNPTSVVAKDSGHDFAIYEGRYLIDPWAAHVEGTAPRAAWDLQNPMDAAQVRELYGDVNTWTMVKENDKPVPRGIVRLLKEDYSTIPDYRRPRAYNEAVLIDDPELADLQLRGHELNEQGNELLRLRQQREWTPEEAARFEEVGKEWDANHRRWLEAHEAWAAPRRAAAQAEMEAGPLPSAIDELAEEAGEVTPPPRAVEDTGVTPTRPRPMPNRDEYTEAHKVIRMEEGGPVTEGFRGEGERGVPPPPRAEPTWEELHALDAQLDRALVKGDRPAIDDLRSRIEQVQLRLADEGEQAVPPPRAVEAEVLPPEGEGELFIDTTGQPKLQDFLEGRVSTPGKVSQVEAPSFAEQWETMTPAEREESALFHTGRLKGEEGVVPPPRATQQRLPGDVGDVQDLEIPTPEEELPFQLGREPAPPAKAPVQPGLFGEPPPKVAPPRPSKPPKTGQPSLFDEVTRFVKETKGEVDTDRMRAIITEITPQQVGKWLKQVRPLFKDEQWYQRAVSLHNAGKPYEAHREIRQVQKAFAQQLAATSARDLAGKSRTAAQKEAATIRAEAKEVFDRPDPPWAHPQVKEERVVPKAYAKAVEQDPSLLEGAPVVMRPPGTGPLPHIRDIDMHLGTQVAGDVLRAGTDAGIFDALKQPFSIVTGKPWRKDTKLRLFKQLADRMLRNDHPNWRGSLAELRLMHDNALAPVEQVVRWWVNKYSAHGRGLGELGNWARQRMKEGQIIKDWVEPKFEEGLEDLVIAGDDIHAAKRTARQLGMSESEIESLGRKRSTTGKFKSEKGALSLGRSVPSNDHLMRDVLWGKTGGTGRYAPGQPQGTMNAVENMTRAIMVSQLPTAERNLWTGAMRYGLGGLDDLSASLVATLRGDTEMARRHWNQAKRMAQGLTRPGATPGRPWASSMEDIYQFNADAMTTKAGKALSRRDIRRSLAVLEQLSRNPNVKHAAAMDFLGDVGGEAWAKAIAAQPTSRLGKLGKAALSPEVRNYMLTANRYQEYTVRSVVFDAAFRAQLDTMGFDSTALLMRDFADVVVAVGPDRLDDAARAATYLSLDYTFAAGAYPGSIPDILLQTMSKYWATRVPYPFPRFNFADAPRMIYDHSLAPLLFDVPAAALYKMGLTKGTPYGRLAKGLAAETLRRHALPKLAAQKRIAQASHEAAWLTYKQRVLQGRQLAKEFRNLHRQMARAEAKGQALPGQKFPMEDRLTELGEQLGALEEAKITARKGIADTRAAWAEITTTQRQLRSTVDKATRASAPTFDQFVGRQMTGLGMLGAAWVMRSSPGAEGTQWYEYRVKMPEAMGGRTVNMDFRAFAPFAQYLFVADTIEDLRKHTDWDRYHAIMGNTDPQNEKEYRWYDFAEAMRQSYDGPRPMAEWSKDLVEAFLSISRTAGATLSLADLLTGRQTDKGQLRNITDYFLGSLGQFLSRVTVPLRQVTDVTALWNPEAGIARIPETDPASLLFGPTISNIPYLRETIPPKISATTGEPLETLYPTLRTLTGVTMRIRRPLEVEMRSMGLKFSDATPRQTGDRQLDNLMAKAFFRNVNQVMPEIMADPEIKALPLVIRKQIYMKIFNNMKKAARGEVTDTLSAGMTGQQQIDLENKLLPPGELRRRQYLLRVFRKYDAEQAAREPAEPADTGQIRPPPRVVGPEGTGPIDELEGGADDYPRLPEGIPQ